MASKINVALGCFHFETFCSNGTAEINQIARNSSNVRHTISVYNGSTLPADIKAKTTFPDAASYSVGQFDDHAGNVGTEWTFNAPRLDDGSTHVAYATIMCANPLGLAAVRIQTVEAQRRDDPSVQWQDLDRSKLPLSIDITIV